MSPRPLPPGRFLQVPPGGLVTFCLHCARYAHALMKSSKYAVDWTAPRVTAYEAGLEAICAWTEKKSATREETDAAGQAAVEAFAAAECAVMNAIDAGDDTRGARAARSAALGMVVPLATIRGADAAAVAPWMPTYREDLGPRSDGSPPWSKPSPDAPLRTAVAAAEDLQRAMPAVAWASALDALEACLGSLRSTSGPDPAF